MNAKYVFHLVLAFACLATFAGCKTNPPTAPHAGGDKNTYVLVHGAWGGGWDWRHVDDLLTADGNKVFRVTLTGQGERSHLASTNIDLDTHIQDIVNVILWEDLHDVVLVGHSYGGMVVTGVADRVPGRIRRVVYLDALLPENGENVRAIQPKKIVTADKDGFILAPWVKANQPPPHDVPMSERTFSEPITLTNQAVAGKLPATFILTVDADKPAEQDDFYRFYLRAQARGWPAWIMTGDHNVQRSHPRELAKLLERAARGGR